MPIIGSPVPPDPEVLILDPVTEDAANSELVISTSPYGLLEHHYPQPPIIAQWATSVDTEGSLLGSVKHDNRQIQIVLDVEGLDALRDLQAKLGKLHREGGTLQRTLGDGTVIVFDVLSADGYDPSFDQTYVLGGVANVQFTLTCLPYGRGLEQDLGDNTETTLPVLVFTDTGVKGDIPGLGRLVIDDDSANAQLFAVWGVQSRYYSSASTAALFYQAESCAVISPSVAAVGVAGASGSGSNVVRNTSIGPTGAWSGLVYIGASSTAQTHVGAFRVFARVYLPGTNTGTVSLRCKWAPYVGAANVTNAEVPVTLGGGPMETSWVLMDLGLVSIPKVTVGTQGWLGKVEASSTASGDDIDIDWLMLVPADESSGQTLGDAGGDLPVAASGSLAIRHDGVFASVSGGYWRRPPRFEGDYLRIPPAGAEGRTTRVIVKMARGQTSGGVGTPYMVDYPMVTDPGIDDLSARLYVTPRYLAVPSA